MRAFVADGTCLLPPLQPYNVVSVLNASFPSSVPKETGPANTSVYLLPSFKYVPFLPRGSHDSIQALTKGFLLPEQLSYEPPGLSPERIDRLTRKPEYQRLLDGVKDVEDIMILICGHGGRDMRCGVMGPVLRQEFETQLPGEGVQVLQGPANIDVEPSASAAKSGAVKKAALTARVGLISHIGGHKFAGNVIIYLPPSMKTSQGQPHPLAGHGIWYGRVEPKHVHGIITETIFDGNVIKDMFRGAITPDRKIVRL